MPPKVVRRQSIIGGRHSRLAAPLEGEKPADAVEHYSKLDSKKKHGLYLGLIGHSRIQCSGFLANLDKNRALVPIHEHHRVKANSKKKGDVEYVPATYAKVELDDYVIWQAPTKDNVAAFWRKIWQDNSKIIVSLSDTFSATDSKQCYSYWPTKENEVLKLENGRYVIKLEKKHVEENCKGMFVYELKLSSTDPGDALVEKEGSDGGASTEEEPASDKEKERVVALYHFPNWPEGTWPNLDNLASFLQAVARREVQNMRKSKCDLLPPVVIQSYNGLGRAAVAWVGAILAKDVSKKDCFDIPDLIKKCIKLRPGSFHNKLYYFVAFAVGFRQAGHTKWMDEEDSNKYANQIESDYKQHK